MRTTLLWIGLALCPALDAAVLTHDYLLNGTLADSLGGPSLVSQGGTITSTGYNFPANQGLSVSSAFLDSTSYSIVLDFSFTDLSGYRRIVEFKNRAADTGLYNLNAALNFFNVVTAGTNDFVANQPLRVVITRDGATGNFAGYINGSGRIGFTDSSSLATFSGPSNIAYFFEDDSAVGNEASAGTVTRIKIYDGALNVDQVALLGGPEPTVPPTGTPEPATFALIGAGLAALKLRRRCA